jgi:hypothetical protein
MRHVAADAGLGGVPSISGLQPIDSTALGPLVTGRPVITDAGVDLSPPDQLPHRGLGQLESFATSWVGSYLEAAGRAPARDRGVARRYG